VVVDKLNHAGDRIIWESPTEMLDDIWKARAERDAARRRISDLEMIIKFMQNGDEIYEVQ
jgi:hypothetical protein